QIYARTFQEMRPRTPLPSVRVEFRRYANANAQVKLENGLLHVKMADTLAGAPATVIEALAEILLFKLFRRPVPRDSNDRYRRYLNRNASRTMLGHYDAPHNAIVLSRILDRPRTPRVAVEYVLYHEMLHLRFPAEHRGARRCVHTREFKAAEKQFEKFQEARAALKLL